MKPIELPLPALGVDVVSPEGDLPEGAVRYAYNATLHDNGAFDRRPGYVDFLTLPGAHSLWHGQNGTYVAAEGKLYSVNLGAAAASLVFSGLPVDDPVEYAEIGESLYFTCNGVLRKRVGNAIYTPGVADLSGVAPVLAAATGSLPLASYGVAYSLINALGEESGLSLTTFAIGTGFNVSGIASAADAVKVRVYITKPNGKILYANETLTWAGAVQLRDRTQGREGKPFRMPLPGGEYIRHYRGRLYSAFGTWLCYSDALNYGLSDIRDGWMPFPHSITLLEAVRDGLFVGGADSVTFLRGTGPQDFKPTRMVGFGALPHTGVTVPAQAFNPELVPDGVAAVWLTERGLAIARPDGSVVLPQAERIRLTASGGRTAFVHANSVRQLVVALDGLDFVFDSDSTSLARAISAAVAFAGAATVEPFSQAGAGAANVYFGGAGAAAFAAVPLGAANFAGTGGIAPRAAAATTAHVGGAGAAAFHAFPPAVGAFHGGGAVSVHAGSAAVDALAGHGAASFAGRIATSAGAGLLAGHGAYGAAGHVSPAFNFPATLNMTVGQGVSLAPYVTSASPLVWTTQNTAQYTLSAQGLLTVLVAGSVSISVEVDDGFSP